MGGTGLVKYLLDTHIWIWAVSKPEKLSSRVKQILNSESGEFFISSISVWEFVVLVEKGRISINKSVENWLTLALTESHINEIPVDMEVALKSREIKLPHQDPADRFIAATALINGMTLITSDGKLSKSRELSIEYNT
jgi:PIN domain nuclease of toxin-antitoxin system